MELVFAIAGLALLITYPAVGRSEISRSSKGILLRIIATLASTFIVYASVSFFCKGIEALNDEEIITGLLVFIVSLVVGLYFFVLLIGSIVMPIRLVERWVRYIIRDDDKSMPDL